MNAYQPVTADRAFILHRVLNAPAQWQALAPFAEVNGKKVSTAWAQNARNKLAMALELNLKFDEVKEIFYGLIKEADIFMEKRDQKNIHRNRKNQ